MKDLHDFVAARLDEDEAIAKAVEDNSAPFNGQWYNDEGHALRTANDWVLAYQHHGVTFPPGLLDHLARHDPARVLREAEAMRSVLKRRADLDEQMSTVARDPSQRHNLPMITSPAYALDIVLRRFALAHEHHPDFQEHWRLPSPEHW
jgi:hypothetical protein